MMRMQVCLVLLLACGFVSFNHGASPKKDKCQPAKGGTCILPQYCAAGGDKSRNFDCPKKKEKCCSKIKSSEPSSTKRPEPSSTKPPEPSSTKPPQDPAIDCAAIKKLNPSATDGVYTIKLKQSGRSVEVWCDMYRDGGGWTVFQKRGDYEHQENFFRGWNDYKKGFGDPKESYWLGLDAIHELTHSDSQELRIDLQDFNQVWKYAEYNLFQVGSEHEQYKLTVGGFHGTLGDSLTLHTNKPFITKDLARPKNYCANKTKGAWWYLSCHYSNLNGQYLRGAHKTYGDGVNWYNWHGYYYSLKVSEMKIRPNSFYRHLRV